MGGQPPVKGMLQAARVGRWSDKVELHQLLVSGDAVWQPVQLGTSAQSWWARAAGQILILTHFSSINVWPEKTFALIIYPHNRVRGFQSSGHWNKVGVFNDKISPLWNHIDSSKNLKLAVQYFSQAKCFGLQFMTKCLQFNARLTILGGQPLIF